MTVKQTHVLFVCSRNQWRSPTAEQLWRNHPNLSVRSGGTSSNARHSVSLNDIQWSHAIFVMEEKHKIQLKAKFHAVLDSKRVYILDIPDEYQFMDPELIDLLQQSVESILDLS